jgi:hypothetical protein
LLARIAAEELLVELAADLGDDDVLGGADLVNLLGPLRQPGRQLRLGEAQPVKGVDRVEVDRNRHLLAIDHTQHLVLVGPPRREPRQIVEDAARVGVEDMRPVLMDQHAGRIGLVISVAGDVVAPVDHHDALAPLVGETLREHAPGKPRPDDQPIVH